MLYICVSRTVDNTQNISVRFCSIVSYNKTDKSGEFINLNNSLYFHGPEVADVMVGDIRDIGFNVNSKP